VRIDDPLEPPSAAVLFDAAVKLRDKARSAIARRLDAGEG
jgi:hypothetical protein